MTSFPAYSKQKVFFPQRAAVTSKAQIRAKQFRLRMEKSFPTMLTLAEAREGTLQTSHNRNSFHHKTHPARTLALGHEFKQTLLQACPAEKEGSGWPLWSFMEHNIVSKHPPGPYASSFTDRKPPGSTTSLPTLIEALISARCAAQLMHTQFSSPCYRSAIMPWSLQSTGKIQDTCKTEASLKYKNSPIQWQNLPAEIGSDSSASTKT